MIEGLLRARAAASRSVRDVPERNLDRCVCVLSFKRENLSNTNSRGNGCKRSTQQRATASQLDPAVRTNEVARWMLHFKYRANQWRKTVLYIVETVVPPQETLEDTRLVNRCLASRHHSAAPITPFLVFARVTAATGRLRIDSR